MQPTFLFLCLAMQHKAGFVNIIGLPNVGKSTLMNALVGERMSIISPKAQTTRHRIIGIVNSESYQIVFTDTPGYINQPAYELQKTMNESVAAAVEDADVLLLVTDKFQNEENERVFAEVLHRSAIPSLVVLNKIDLYGKEELAQLTAKLKDRFPKSDILPLSAASGISTKKIIRKISALLPDSPPYYEKDVLTDRNLRFFVAEIVREKIFLHYTKEIPYTCQVIAEEYSEGKKLDRIKCTIFTERESQKAILIGHKGEALKTIGTEARKEIEKFIDKKVYLELTVKVKDKWRNDLGLLKGFGYKNK